MAVLMTLSVMNEAQVVLNGIYCDDETKIVTPKKESSIDLCFLIDVTGSMQPSIDSTKKYALKIAQNTKRTYPDSKFRVSFVGYRDYEDKKRFEVLDFTENIKDFEEYLGHVIATGGGDGPEDIWGSFEKVQKLSWTAKSARALVHIFDAPGHGRRYTMDIFDEHPGESDRISEFIRSFYEMKLSYSMLVMSSHSSVKNMVKIYNEEYQSVYQRDIKILDKDKPFDLAIQDAIDAAVSDAATEVFADKRL